MPFKPARKSNAKLPPPTRSGVRFSLPEPTPAPNNNRRGIGVIVPSTDIQEGMGAPSVSFHQGRCASAQPPAPTPAVSSAPVPSVRGTPASATPPVLSPPTQPSGRQVAIPPPPHSQSSSSQEEDEGDDELEGEGSEYDPSFVQVHARCPKCSHCFLQGLLLQPEHDGDYYPDPEADD